MLNNAPHGWFSAELVNVLTESSHCFQECFRSSGLRCLYNGFAQKFGWITVYLSMPTVRSWWSQWGSLSLLFMMKLMVWHVVSNTHKVMTISVVVITFLLLVWSFFAYIVKHNVCSILTFGTAQADQIWNGLFGGEMFKNMDVVVS
jgi:hypothetical protein